MRKINMYSTAIFSIFFSSFALANTVIIQHYGPFRPYHHRTVVVDKTYLPCAREKIVRYEHSREVIVYKNKCRAPYASKTVIYR